MKNSFWVFIATSQAWAIAGLFSDNRITTINSAMWLFGAVIVTLIELNHSRKELKMMEKHISELDKVLDVEIARMKKEEENRKPKKAKK